MAEYIVPNIQKHYEYQLNSLQCWAAVAVTMWRWKNGRAGPGAASTALFSRPGGQPFKDVIDFSTEVNIEAASKDLPLDMAASNVRLANRRYNDTPTGLPANAADRMFTWMGCSSTAISPATTPEDMRTLIRTKGPLAIFTVNPGHLQIIVGYYEGDPKQPQIIMFNPERYILQMAANKDPNLETSAIREDRWLWPHWQGFFANNLVGSKAWHF